MISSFINSNSLPTRVVLFRGRRTVTNTDRVRTNNRSHETTASSGGIVRVTSISLNRSVRLLACTCTPTNKNSHRTNKMIHLSPQPPPINYHHRPPPTDKNKRTAHLASLPTDKNREINSPRPALATASDPPTPTVESNLRPRPIILTYQLTFTCGRLYYLLSGSTHR